jgi:hypothetical protein
MAPAPVTIGQPNLLSPFPAQAPGAFVDLLAGGLAPTPDLSLSKAYTAPWPGTAATGS